ncbi:MAG: hypothetical protein JXR71_06665 [Bacteroidales bacterium]|nr:hypothetical protein [Bacteroidales bacterium]
MENYSNNRHSASKDGKLIIGGILIIIGALIMLGNFDFIDRNVSHYIFNWKSILIFLGIYLLAARPNKKSGYILMGIGIVFWLPELFGESIYLHQVFWPLILIGLGYLLIRRHQHSHDPAEQISHKGAEGYLEDASIFGGGVKVIQSKNFKGGNITAIFGGSEFDMRDVEMAGDVAIIDIFTIFGGTKIIIPENWTVVSDAFSMFGGLSDKRRVSIKDQEGNKLVIKGLVIFGGVEIKSF